jgi:hypothetical protein
MNDEMTEALKQQLAAFEEKFGRPPGPNDPVFFNPDSDVPEFMSEHQIVEFGAVVGDAMRQAGVDPAKAYAYEKLGFIATRENWPLLDAEQRKEWQDAVAEYEAIPEN